MTTFANYNNNIVTVESVCGGWTTVALADGTVKKVRNGAIKCIKSPMSELTDEQFDAEIDAEIDDQFDAEIDAEIDANIKMRKIGDMQYDPTKYVKTKSASGVKSSDSGDLVAITLRGKSLREVYDMVAHAKGVSVDDLIMKYQHLNTGMQRMNLGNILRRI